MKFSKESIKNDICAGLVIALVTIPIAMGYAQIAGLPAVYGLYGSIFPILIFALTTSSKQLVIGVDAMPAAMVGTLVSELGIIEGSKQAVSLSAIVAFLVALWFLLFFVLKAGRAIKYISNPVMSGFISGVSISIILIQTPKLFGGAGGKGEIINLLINIIEQLHLFNGASFALGILAIVIIFVGKKYYPGIPFAAIVLIASGIFEGIFHFENYGVKLIESFEGHMPPLFIPEFSFCNGHWSEIVSQSLSVAVIILAQTLLVGNNYARKNHYRMDNRREMLSYAAVNTFSGLFGCAPLCGSVSRSSIADSFGAKSQFVSLTAAAAMLVFLTVGAPLMGYLPIPVLAAIIIAALSGSVDVKQAVRLYKANKREWFIFMASLLSVLVFGCINGVLVGIILSFWEVTVCAINPPRALVGRIPGQGNFYSLKRNKTARAVKNTVIYRFSGNIFFANVEQVLNEIEASMKKDTRQVIIDARGVGSVDITAVDQLVLFYSRLKKKGIRFYIAEHEGSLNDQFLNYGGAILVNEGVIRRTITLALRDAGVSKPYELEGEELQPVMEEENRLSEFEWLFGEAAEHKIDMLAEDVAKKFIEEDERHRHIDESILEERGVVTSWGTLGLFDEDEFLTHLELKLEKYKDENGVSEKLIAEIEEHIENRRRLGQEKLSKLNPNALKLLEKKS